MIGNIVRDVPLSRNQLRKSAEDWNNKILKNKKKLGSLSQKKIKKKKKKRLRPCDLIESCSYVYMQLLTMLLQLYLLKFRKVFKTKYTLYIASGSGPYYRPSPHPPGARLIHISTHFALSLAPLLSTGMPRQSRFDPDVSTVQADIFFCEVGAQSVGLLP